MKRFKEIDNKRKAFIMSGVSVVMFITILFLYKTYAIYQERKSFNVIEGVAPNQEYDLKFAFLMEDEQGNKKYLNEMPIEKKYDVEISCNNNATGVWDYESWGPLINNLSKIRTKCNIIFKASKPLKEYGIDESLVDSGSGLYLVTHDKDYIDYTLDYSKRELLKQTEYRYVGENPDNYISFNDELWRIIGLVNTIEGQRLKIVRDESIGDYSWDTSELSINSGYGINEWSKSDLVALLNRGAYYNRGSGTCYIDYNNVTTPCDFGNSGLLSESKKMIDSITWNTGTNGDIPYTSLLVKNFYSYERSAHTGKICETNNFCNDSVIRQTTWKGQVGLMYPSDYFYAMGGGEDYSREKCLSTIATAFNINSDNKNCVLNNWIYKGGIERLMTPGAVSHATDAFIIHSSGYVSGYNVYNIADLRPTLYLKGNVNVFCGEGTKENPYHLVLK